jgi:excisionase family DNA binding protein
MEISIKDAAELLGKSERTVRHMAQTGRLPARRIGARWLINRDDLLARKAAGTTDDADVDADADFETAEVEADDDSTDEPTTPRASPSRQGFTVDWQSSAPNLGFDRALPPGVITSVRELPSFHVATELLAELGELRREVKDTSRCARPRATCASSWPCSPTAATPTCTPAATASARPSRAPARR